VILFYLLQFFAEAAQNSLLIPRASRFREFPRYSRFFRFVATLSIHTRSKLFNLLI